MNSIIEKKKVKKNATCLSKKLLYKKNAVSIYFYCVTVEPR